VTILQNASQAPALPPAKVSKTGHYVVTPTNARSDLTAQAEARMILLRSAQNKLKAVNAMKDLTA